MNMGLLWYDDDPRHSLPEKVRAAAAQYQARFGQAPTMCYVNPEALGQVTRPAVENVRLAAGWRLDRNHLWMGITE